MKWKFCLLAAGSAGIIIVQEVLALGGGSGNGASAVLAAVGVVFCLLMTAATVPALHRDAKLA
ncbi:MAG: hypothetical protein ACYCXW_13235, partial [Solirubrobacteraceae bacterium]